MLLLAYDKIKTNNQQGTSKRTEIVTESVAFPKRINYSAEPSTKGIDSNTSSETVSKLNAPTTQGRNENG